MTPIDLKEYSRKELENEFMKMPNLETKPKEIHHEITIESTMVYKDKFCLGGTNENGEYINVWYDSHEFLKTVNIEKLKEIKSKLVQTINKIK